MSRLATACALLGVVLAVPPASTAPSPAGPPGQIVFSKQVGEDRRALVVGRTDGSAAVRITAGPHDTRPQWSPGGRQIVFERRVADDVTSVWIVNADGTGEREFDSDPYAEHPRWSPDGRRIAYQVQTSERIPDGVRAHTTYELWLVRPDGTGRSRLTGGRPGELGDENPVFAVRSGAWAWSPDSRRIAYVVPRGADAPRGAVWVVDVATRATRYVGPGSDVAWSPDGRRLATTTNDEALVGDAECGTIWVLAVGSRGRDRLAPRPERACDRFPRWSPDGLTVAFERVGKRTVRMTAGLRGVAPRVAPRLGPGMHR